MAVIGFTTESDRWKKGASDVDIRILQYPVNGRSFVGASSCMRRGHARALIDQEVTSGLHSGRSHRPRNPRGAFADE